MANDAGAHEYDFDRSFCQLELLSGNQRRATQPWNLAFVEGGSTQSVSVPGGGTLFLHTLGTNSGTSVGWAQIQSSSAGVVAYAIFTQRVPGRTDQDGTASAAASASRILVPFDNSTGFATTIAVANPTGASEAISVNVELDSGTTSQAFLPALPAQGHAAFALSQQFPATSGHRGLAEFYVSSGSFSIIALRFNPTGAFTAASVYTQTGGPIIGTPSGGGGGGMLPAFTFLTVTNGTFSPQGQSNFTLTLAIAGSSATGWVGSVGGGNVSAALAFDAVWTSASVNGLTFTFSGLKTGRDSIMEDLKPNGDTYGITSGSLTVTLSPASQRSHNRNGDGLSQLDEPFLRRSADQSPGRIQLSKRFRRLR